MFTGLVQAVGSVAASESRGSMRRLVVDPLGWLHQAALGDSIAVMGCCLTVAEEMAGKAGAGGGWAFDVVAETLEKTTLGRLGVGSRVNLEHAVTAGAFLGGHLVQGHVDGVGRVVSVKPGDDWRLQVRVPPGLAGYLTPKGSVCLDGVSLTIAGIEGEVLEVALIPTTLAKTTLGGLSVGGEVNVECDTIVKTVVEHLRRSGR